MTAFLGMLVIGIASGLAAQHWTKRRGPEGSFTAPGFGVMGALIGGTLGAWCELYSFSDAQLWLAASIGAVLALLAYGGPTERSMVGTSVIRRGNLSVAAHATDLRARSNMSSP